MELRPGSRWRSSVCSAEVVVVRSPKVAAVLECGGHPMTAHGAERPGNLEPAPDRRLGVQVGKRYSDDETGLEALCNKAGEGSLSIDGRPLKIKEAKPLPSSD